MRDRFHRLEVKRVVPETDDSVSLVLDVPLALADAFRYRAGQFVTVRVDVDGERHLRSYSMSSAPGIDADLQVTVKRVPGGLVSNHLNDVAAGDGRIALDVSEPAGGFVLTDRVADVVAFAAGSGITPIYSIVKAALFDTGRRVRLLFANRDRGAAIFGPALDGLASTFGDRLLVRHHEDLVDGFVGPADVAGFVAVQDPADVYLCGPGGFMDVVEAALRAPGVGIDPARIHVERFTPGEAVVPADDVHATAPVEHATVTITLGPRTEVVVQRGRATLLESARRAGLRAPASCEAGHCATCMARVVAGHAEMVANDVLTDEEVAEGWVLTCQARPVTSTISVRYE